MRAKNFSDADFVDHTRITSRFVSVLGKFDHRVCTYRGEQLYRRGPIRPVQQKEWFAIINGVRFRFPPAFLTAEGAMYNVMSCSDI